MARDARHQRRRSGRVPVPGQSAGGRAMSAGGRRAAAVLDRDQLDLDAAAVLDALPRRGGMGPATVADRAGLDLGTVMRSLGALAAGGFAERCEQGWRARGSLPAVGRRAAVRRPGRAAGRDACATVRVNGRAECVQRPGKAFAWLVPNWSGRVHTLPMARPQARVAGPGGPGPALPAAL